MKKEIISVMKRYELKYCLNKEQVQYFLNEVSSYLKLDKYGLTSISSIYFDTPNYFLIRKSIEKPFFKEKIRLRSYGLAKIDSPVFLEIKRKNDKIVYKRRIMTSEEKAYSFLDSGVNFDQSQISRELEGFREKYGELEPKILIIYDRMAFYQENSDIRVTLDMNPRYRVNDLNLHSSFDGNPLLEEGEAILEIKVKHSIPLWLVEILNKGKIEVDKNSSVSNFVVKFI
ncbi:MAG: polyphosphate polymerase domain-containing protein [Bacilli bacterium]|nr:polyphosphate polymerase domain-containing protein [Bacilli bacterium]